MSELTLTRDNFDAITGAGGLVMVDFWATWCGPCRMMAPVVAGVAEDRPDVTVGKVNVDDEPELSNRFGINAIPTLVFFKDGKAVQQAVGLQQKSALERTIDGVKG